MGRAGTEKRDIGLESNGGDLRWYPARAHGAGPGRNLVGKEPLGRLGLELS